MNLPDSALSWAATRSGKSLGDFISSLTPEREIEIMDAYNRWRGEHGLPEVELIPSHEEPRQRKPAEAYDHKAISNAELWAKTIKKGVL